MCIAVPGKVISIDGSRAIIDYNGNRVEAQAGLVDAKTGDSVLVHAGCIIQVLSEEDSNFLQEIFAEIENL